MKASGVALAILSPTRAIIDRRKQQPNVDRGTILKNWNRNWLIFEVAAFVAIYLISVWHAESAVSVRGRLLTYIVLWLLPFSRCNEIVYAFYRDSMDKLHESPAASRLTPADRIQLLIKSYVGLTINFSIIYFLLPTCMYSHGFESPIHALYFSGVTITTLGFGDITPTQDLSRILAVYEVFAGILLVVLALTIYLSSLSEKAHSRSEMTE